jgi:hypothetical protein
MKIFFLEHYAHKSFFKDPIQSSYWNLKMDKNKCPKSKTKSRIYFYFITEKNLVKNNDKYVMIYDKTTEILI